MGRVRQVSLDPRRTKRVFECLYYHGKDLCVGCREMACSTLSHLRGHRNMPWERRSADTIYCAPRSSGSASSIWTSNRTLFRSGKRAAAPAPDATTRRRDPLTSHVLAARDAPAGAEPMGVAVSCGGANPHAGGCAMSTVEAARHDTERPPAKSWRVQKLSADLTAD